MSRGARAAAFATGVELVVGHQWTGMLHGQREPISDEWALTVHIARRTDLAAGRPASWGRPVCAMCRLGYSPVVSSVACRGVCS